MTQPHVTCERLQELFRFDSETGVFWRFAPINGAKAGPTFGALNSSGRYQIRVDGRRYMAHRLAWLMVHGQIDDALVIDHINGDPRDNRIANLRLVSHQVNSQNRRAPAKDSRSGALGVAWYPKRGKFRAAVRIDGKTKHLGHFDTSEAAYEAYLAAKRIVHPGCTL